MPTAASRPGPPEELRRDPPTGAADDTLQLDTERALSIPVPDRDDTRATLTVMCGAGAGRTVALFSERTLLGRSTRCDLVVEDMAVSRVHGCVHREQDVYWLEDLGSTNGTFLRGARVERARLESGDRLQLGPRTVVRFAVADRLERELLTTLVESSTRDGLTGAFNRAFFEQRLESEIAYARRHGSQLAVLMLDLDRFKAINDTHGHPVGDDVLRAVTREIRATLRSEDLLARYGGEEFAVIARAATNLDAMRLAERIRAAVARVRVPTGATAAGATAVGVTAVGVTVSIGVARHAECRTPCTPTDLIKLADARLYRAKAAGRDRCWPVEPDTEGA